LSTEASHQQNLLRAKELLAEAGHEMGEGLPPLEMQIHKGEVDKEQRRFFEECMSSIGVEVKGFKAKRWSLIMDSDELRDHALVYRAGWIADFPDPDNFLRPLFYSASPANMSRYDNPEIDALLDQALSETSYSARTKLYHKIERTILQDSPIIPLYYDTFSYWFRSEVNGLTISPMGPSYLKLNRIWLAEDETEAAVDY
jgi:ABC-type oligopeptide transport system substrate-binding subunit